MAVLDFSDDDVLVKALVAHDPDAFAFLLDRYHSTLVRLSRQYVPSSAVADEVVQETWLAVINGIDRFEQRSSLKTWLFRILVNIAAHARREGEPLDPVRDNGHVRRGSGGGPAPLSARSTPAGRVEAATTSLVGARAACGRHRDSRHGPSAIDRLPPAQREVITMRDLLGWSAAEVCDALEVSDANQRVLLHRGEIQGPSVARAALRRGPRRMSAAATYMCRQFVEDVTAYLDGALPEATVALIERSPRRLSALPRVPQRDATHGDEDPRCSMTTTSQRCPRMCAIG